MNKNDIVNYNLPVEQRRATFEDYELARNAQRLLIKQGFFVVINRFYDGPALVLVQVVWL